MPRLIDLYSTEGSSYLQRLTALNGLRTLLLAHAASFASSIVPILLTAAKDAVPNVRAFAAALLGEAAAALRGKSAIAAVKPALDVLVADADADTRLAAIVALEKLE